MSDSEVPPRVVNVDQLEERSRLMGEHWGAGFKQLTPAMRPGGGKLGVNWFRVPPGRSVCPFHAHRLEDEAFFVLSGRGVLRYGEELVELGPGDCVSCPAGGTTAHQLGNPFDEDFVYLSIGNHEPEEVCTYPDNGKVMVRGIGKIAHLNEAPYLDGEPDKPKLFELWEAR